MSNIFEKFNKIWVNDNEISLSELQTNKGKYHIDNYQGGNVSVKFQLKENEKLTPGIFDGNEQIKNITLSEDFNIEIENGSFAGLTNLSEESKQTISAKVGENVFEPKQEEPVEPEEPEFTPKTIHFISYGDNAGTIEYARGSVETTNVTKDDKTKVKVLTNTIEGWDKEFYVDSTAKEDDNNFYQLFKLENDILAAINVWVKLFSTSQIPEEQTEQFYFSIGQEEVTNDNYTTVNNVQLVTKYPSEVQEFTPEVNNENVYILVKNDKTIVVTDPNLESAIINTLVEEININDEYKVVYYNKITGSINIQIN